MLTKLDWNTHRPLFLAGDLELLNPQLSFFPKQNFVLFMPSVNQYMPGGSAYESNFRENSMTIFSVIYEMYTTELITRLHVNAVVLPELNLWIQTTNDLSAKYGTAWSFYKLLEPTESLTPLRRFRTLGCAAISWKR